MRLFGSAAVGFFVALGLFLLMYALIAGELKIDESDLEKANLDFVRVKQDDIENVKDRRKPPPPEEPKEPPPPPKLTVQNNDKPPPDIPDIQTPNVAVAIGGNGPYLGGMGASGPPKEGDVIPIVMIQPQYPREALLDGTEGWVKLGFTIEADGSVSDVEVLEAEPRRLFDRSARQAMYKWKFKPRVVDGQAIARRASYTLNFNLNQ
ncbi:MAG: energy transducer TonB [Pseudomonadota bacterium]